MYLYRYNGNFQCYTNVKRAPVNKTLRYIKKSYISVTFVDSSKFSNWSISRSAVLRKTIFNRILCVIVTLFRKKEPTARCNWMQRTEYTYTVYRARVGNRTRAHATSVTARGGVERDRARLVPSRGFLIESVQKVLSRIHDGEHATSIGYRGATTLKCRFGHPAASFFLFVFLCSTWLATMVVVMVVVGARKDTEKEDSWRSRELQQRRARESERDAIVEEVRDGIWTRWFATSSIRAFPIALRALYVDFTVRVWCLGIFEFCYPSM